MNSTDLRCGDALGLFNEIENESIDLIISDPPYNLGKDYGNNHDNKGIDEYLDFTKSWLAQAKRVLKPEGSIYVFMGVRFISYLYDILERDLGMLFNSWIVWHYTQGIGKTRGFSQDMMISCSLTKVATSSLILMMCGFRRNTIAHATI